MSEKPSENVTSDIESTAAEFHAFLIGISTQARDGRALKALDATATEIMSL